MRSIILSFCLVLIFGLPTASQVSVVRHTEKTLPVSNEWIFRFKSGVNDNCGISPEQRIRACVNFKEKIVYFNQDFLKYDRSYLRFAKTVIHEIGHIYGMRHSTKHNAWIEDQFELIY